MYITHEHPFFLVILKFLGIFKLQKMIFPFYIYSGVTEIHPLILWWTQNLKGKVQFLCALKIPKKIFHHSFTFVISFYLPKSGICYVKKSILWKGGGIERKRINLTAFYSFTFNNKSIIIIYSILFFTLYTKHTWWKIEILFIILIFYSFNIFRYSTFLFSQH